MIADLRAKQNEIIAAQTRASLEQSKALFNESASVLLNDPRMQARAAKLDLRATVQEARQEQMRRAVAGSL
jgi:hypothetical protein